MKNGPYQIEVLLFYNLLIRLLQLLCCHLKNFFSRDFEM